MLDEIIRETERRRRGLSTFGVAHVDNPGAFRCQSSDVLADRDRLAALAERVGPKGALAGLLAEMRQFASSP